MFKIKNRYFLTPLMLLSFFVFPDSAFASTYEVKKGDTLWKISREHNTTVNELKKINGLSSDLIKIGQVITLPDSSPKESSSETTPPSKQTFESLDINNEFVYNPKINMSFENQKYLYDLTVERDLDYKKALAVIMIESNFRSNAIGGNNYGYFQIHKINHNNLSKTLNTKNDPLDPKTNLNWGTYMLSTIKKKYQEQGLEGNELLEAVLSEYNRGATGYEKYGKATKYIEKHNQALKKINELFS